MAEDEASVAHHYTRTNLGNSILAALGRMGKDVNSMELADLAPVDEFHIRGRGATRELAGLIHPDDGMQVLDVGCGLGGSARYLAHAFGCRVTGLDLIGEYCTVAAMLSQRLGLGELVEFRQGSALEMPFEDGAFDLVWSEHAQMNIADKPRLYGEIHRVLRAGGRFAFHDVLQGRGGAPYYPAPWAAEAAISALITPGDLRQLLQSLGFDVAYWEDKTVSGRDWFRKRLAGLRANGPPPLGLHLLVGQQAMEMQENNLRNLEENRIALLQGVLEKVR